MIAVGTSQDGRSVPGIFGGNGGRLWPRISVLPGVGGYEKVTFEIVEFFHSPRIQANGAFGVLRRKGSSVQDVRPHRYREIGDGIHHALSVPVRERAVSKTGLQALQYLLEAGHDPCTRDHSQLVAENTQFIDQLRIVPCGFHDLCDLLDTGHVNVALLLKG